MNDQLLTPELLNQKCTYVTESEIRYMREEMSKLIPSDATIVMVGAGPGLLVFSLLDSCVSENWKITIIDIDSIQWAKAHYGLAKPCVSAYVPKIQWIEGRDSYDVGKEWATPLDLLIIDGDHTERGVTRDQEVWIPHLKVGGIVYYHDYKFTDTQWENCPRDEYPETAPYIDKLHKAPKWKKIGRVGTSIVFKEMK